MSGHLKQWEADRPYVYGSKDQHGPYIQFSFNILRPGTVDHGRRVVSRIDRKQAENLRDSLTSILEKGY